ncbi:transposon Tf2-8 polyprotein [Trichonephila clavipes]|nr:transposon Tf2-8 polyprotein [Trichonephila clavipes]
MLEQSICHPSKSLWSSPLHVVAKSSGSFRPVGDYRKLNAVTTPDRYPIPHIQDFSRALYNEVFFSKIGSKRNDNRKINWSEQAISEFQNCETLLANATLLVLPNPNANLVLQVDASDFAIGGALFQTEGEYIRPLAFFSRKLSENEKGYSAYDRVACHARQLNFISQFTTDIRHIKGSDNLTAYTQSRIASIHKPNPTDYNETVKAQEKDSELISLINNPQSTEHWSDALPAILLGFRTTYKEALQSSSAELVYGTTIRLPGEFFDSSPMDSSPIQPVENLKSHFDSIRPSPASSYSKISVFVHPALKDCSHVFIRNVTVRKPLQAPFDGSFKILHRTHKTFDVDINGQKSTISIDLVMPAFLESDSVQPPVVTETVLSDKACIPVTRKKNKIWKFYTEEVLRCEKKIAIAGARSGQMVDALKLPNQLPEVLASHYRSVWPDVVLMEHNNSSVGQSLASNGSVVDSRDLNLVFGHAEVTPNK